MTNMNFIIDLSFIEIDETCYIGSEAFKQSKLLKKQELNKKEEKDKFSEPDLLSSIPEETNTESIFNELNFFLDDKIGKLKKVEEPQKSIIKENAIVPKPIIKPKINHDKIKKQIISKPIIPITTLLMLLQVERLRMMD